LIQRTRVTDRQTDRIAVAYTRYGIYAVVCKNDSVFSFVLDVLLDTLSKSRDSHPTPTPASCAQLPLLLARINISSAK